jgi:succinoglycan biosynthesis protein ExoM
MNKVVVGLLTYNRNELLEQALLSLSRIIVPTDLVVSVVVCDNFKLNHAKVVIEKQKLDFSVEYLYEDKKGIPFARNKVVDYAINEGANYVAFFDDDEEVDYKWLQNLYDTILNYNADVSVGRVISIYSEEVDEWVVQSGFFDERRKKTGSNLRYAATSNILYSIKIFKDWGLRYDEKFQFTGGTDNFLAADILRTGGKIVYTDESIVREIVASHRATFKWMYLRKFRCGANDIMYFRRLKKNGFKALLTIGKYGLMSILRILLNTINLLLTFKKTYAYKVAFETALTIGYIAGIFNLKYEEYKKPV